MKKENQKKTTMKTKLLIVAMVLMPFMGKVSAQAYVPMLNNATWNITVANFGGAYDLIINPAVDVTIGSFTYKKFHDPFMNTDVYLREDTAAKRVYRRVNNVDELLYDFSLLNGSYITLSNGVMYSVTVDTVNVVGGTRKRVTLYSNFAETETWIEGVGSNRHPLMRTSEMLSDPYVYLTCSAQSGVNIYNHNIANGQPTPTDCSMLLSTDTFTSHKVSFTPNPVTNELTIAATTPFENATLCLYNSLGQLVQELKNLNSNQIIINREQLADGVYFAQLSQKGTLVTKKLLLTH